MAGETILVVEDYADLADLFQEILSLAGYKVLVAPDGAAGLKVAREHEGHIDVLLTDIVMPNMLGSELAAQLKREHPGLRVIYMSGHAQAALGRSYALDLNTPLLQKPFMEGELLAKIEEVMAGPAAGTTGEG